MIAVPDAALLPMHAAAGLPRELRRATSVGNPSGNTGNGRSRTTPIISQCPVTESLPAEASAMRPTRRRTGRLRRDCAWPSAATRPRPSARSVGSASGTALAMWPSVSLPSSPYAAASGSAPIADAVENDDDGSGGRGQERISSGR